MSKIHSRLPKLIVNRSFMFEFVDADAPCFALGMVDERKEAYAFLALRPGVVIPADVTRSGFRFGHSLRGTDHFEAIHFVFEFYGFGRYHALINPNNALVRPVLTHMLDRGEYFFFAIDPQNHVTTFRAEMGQEELASLRDHRLRIEQSRTDEAQYRAAVTQFKQHPDPPGQFLRWVCRDNPRYLDLSQDRLELSPTEDQEIPSAAPVDEPSETEIPARSWHPLSMLPTIAQLVDEQRTIAQDQYTALHDVRDKPYLLDDHTIGRIVKLHTEQLEDLPHLHEQLMHWRAANPSKAQRKQIERLAAHLDQHEVTLRKILDLTKNLASGTIDTILVMEDGELGQAVFEGRMKLPGGKPHNEAMRVAELHGIAKVLDARVDELVEAGAEPMQLLALMAPQMPMFYRVLEIADDRFLSELPVKYPGLQRFGKMVEGIAAGIRSGDIKVPR